MAQGTQRCVIAIDCYHPGDVPPGLAINPRRSGWPCALMKWEMSDGCSSGGCALTLYSGPVFPGLCGGVRDGGSYIVRVLGVSFSYYLLTYQPIN